MKYSDLQRIDKMAEMTEKLLDYINSENITKEQITEQEVIRWTITTPLYNIGEHAYNLSDDFKSEHKEVPWSKISGLRHRLVHDYENTNWTIICAVIYDILPDFLNELHKIRGNME